MRLRLSEGGHWVLVIVGVDDLRATQHRSGRRDGAKRIIVVVKENLSRTERVAHGQCDSRLLPSKRISAAPDDLAYEL